MIELHRILPIRTDVMLDADSIMRLEVLTTRYNLSAYEAAYLDLAQRKGIGLASLDQRLRSASQKIGIKLVPI